ncbi:MAG: hypothetical protein IJP75_11730 [Bacteroidaceae bacterium]|nr:hypothetical protein [Bacteroidaceae bacterium]
MKNLKTKNLWKKVILPCVTYILIVLGLLYFEDYYCHRGIVAGIGLILLILSIIPQLRSFRVFGIFCLISGIFMTLGVGVHAVKKGDGTVELRSPLYSHALGTYKSIDTFLLANSYEVWYGQYSPHTHEYYILRRKSQTTCEFWNEYRKIMEDSVLNIEQRDFGHGALDVLRLSNGKLFDLNGVEILPGYYPYVVHTTPFDGIY